MLTIRLSRQGAKKRPYYHIVVTDSRKPRDSGYIEKLGFFNPGASGREEITRLDKERMDYWMSQGGKMSERVKYLYRSHVNGKDLRAKLDAHREASAGRIRKMREDAEKALAAKIAKKEAESEAKAAEGDAPAAESEGEAKSAEGDAPAAESEGEAKSAEGDTPAAESEGEAKSADAESGDDKK